MDPDDGYLPLSALQHLVFCPRQCALIHLEGQWAENRLTAEGRVLHDRVHQPGGETRGDRRRLRGTALVSHRLRLTGQADTVEVDIGAVDGQLRPFPVEYKRGRRKPHDADRVQLCAQALCLEEMLDEPVPDGALFYGAERRREPVAFDPALRARTEAAAAELHGLIAAAVTPAPVFGPKCRSCSLIEICGPETFDRRRSAARWIARILAAP